MASMENFEEKLQDVLQEAVDIYLEGKCSIYHRKFRRKL